MTALRYVLLALALGVVSGCSLDPDSIYYSPPNYCDDNDDCPNGFCDVENNMCLSKEDANYEVYLTVTPSETSLANPTTSLVTEPIKVLAGTQSQDLDLRLPRSVTLAAFIARDELPVKAEVRLSRRPSIVGEEPAVLSGTTLDEAISGEDGEPANFTARVLPGHTYDVSIFPQGDRISDLPPIRLVVAVPQDATFVRVDGVTYPAELDTIVGRVRDIKSAGVASIVVRAIDPVTQLAVSSRALTDVQGNFVLHHMLGEKPYLLQLQAEGSDAAVPVFVADPLKLITGGSGEKIVVVPELLRTPLELKVLNTDGEAVHGAVVNATSTELDLLETEMQARFATSKTTNTSGVAELPLFAGTYDFTITPPSPEEAMSRLAVSEFSLSLEQATNHEEMLVERITVEGTVVRYDQEPMPNVDLQALSHTSQESSFRAHRSNQTTVDEDGEFSLLLDRGRYDLVARPPVDTGLSWSIIPKFDVLDRNPKSPRIELAAPAALRGRVTSADRELVIGAAVRAFALLKDGNESRSVLIGRADTNEVGEFELLLPPEI